MFIIATGYLTVQTFSGKMIFPISDTKITIQQQNTSDKSLTTDSSGKSDNVTIQTPSFESSQSPDNTTVPYALVNIRAEKEGFFTVNMINVQVFPDRQTLQYVEMIPLPEYGNNVPIEIDNTSQNL